jgi:hypothetical protein
MARSSKRREVERGRAVKKNPYRTGEGERRARD